MKEKKNMVGFAYGCGLLIFLHVLYFQKAFFVTLDFVALYSSSITSLVEQTI